MLVAANFRKEVTSTVLWLIGHSVRVQCFRASPYTLGDELLLDLQQIIPTPEASDSMVSMAAKESEERSEESAKTLRQKRQSDFWAKTLEELRKRGVSRYERISPSKENWLASATGVNACSYWLVLNKDKVRVELRLARADASENKRLFDQLHADRNEIEHSFSAQLEWLRKDDEKLSKICRSKPFDGENDGNWPTMVDWLCTNFVRLDAAFSERLASLGKQLNDRPGTSANVPPGAS